MTEREARRLLRETPSSLCVRYLYDRTGEIWFAEHFERRTSGAALGVKAVAATLAVAATVATLTQACGGAAMEDDRVIDAGADADAASPDGGRG
jgi:hypothetical protein